MINQGKCMLFKTCILSESIYMVDKWEEQFSTTDSLDNLSYDRYQPGIDYRHAVFALDL